MPLMTPQQMKQISAQKKQRQQALTQLMQQPFDLADREQMERLQAYLDHFEFSAHKMYLFQSMSELMKIWGGSWVWGLLLPIPEFIGTFLNYTLYIGVAGLILERFSMSDFHQELSEMQQLYNWIMKEGAEVYSPAIDNSDKLRHPEIQRMIELIGPLTSPEQLIAWKKMTREEESSASLISSTLQYAGSLFYKPAPQNSTAAAKVSALKERVEKGEMVIGVIEGLKRAAEYFASNANFKKLATGAVLQLCQQPLQMLRDAAPQILASGRETREQHYHLN